MISNADNTWVMLSSALVMLMTPGLAFFYSGLAPARNTLNTLTMSISCLAVMPLVWYILGYSIAFSEGNPFFGGLAHVALKGVSLSASEGSTIPDATFMVFQMMFAVITPAIISGALVGRMKFKAFAIFVILWSLFIYSPMAHMVWGPGGWLVEHGSIDFAGGTVVHINSGVAAFVAAYILGPRSRVSKSTSSAHNVPFVLLGASLLWFGWYGFNAGSALAGDSLASLAVVTTTLATCASMAVWNVLSWLRGKPSTAIGFGVSAVVGLVGITPAAGFVTPTGAVIIGAVTSIISYLAISMKHKIPSSVDDTLDVFVCHGISGISGCLLTGLFATTTVNAGGADGLFYGNPGLLWKQAMAVGISVAITAVGTAVILFVLKAIMPIKHTQEEEAIGIDIIEHGEWAYDDIEKIKKPD